MAFPEWQNGHRQRDIQIEIGLDSISEGPICLVCGNQTIKSTILYSCGTNIIVRTHALGYRCSVCSENGNPSYYLSSEVMVEFLTAAQLILEAEGDKGPAVALIHGINKHRRLVSQLTGF